MSVSARSSSPGTRVPSRMTSTDSRLSSRRATNAWARSGLAGRHSVPPELHDGAPFVPGSSPEEVDDRDGQDGGHGGGGDELLAVAGDRLLDVALEAAQLPLDVGLRDGARASAHDRGSPR